VTTIGDAIETNDITRLWLASRSDTVAISTAEYASPSVDPAAQS